MRGAKDQGIALDEVHDFRSVTARGVLGTASGQWVMIGMPAFLRGEGVAGLEPLESEAAKLQEDGKTAMFAAVDGRPTGIVAVADPIKATTADAIGELHSLGLSIVMLTGTDIAMRSAGITLVKGDLRGIARAICLSRATMRNIRQNLLFAFVYNALGIPVAAGLLYPVFGLLLSPIIAGAAMSLSSGITPLREE